jgi:hypothetical protein
VGLGVEVVLGVKVADKVGRITTVPVGEGVTKGADWQADGRMDSRIATRGK